MSGQVGRAVAFATDAAGLERFLRFFHSIFIILTSCPSLLSNFLLSSQPSSLHGSSIKSILQLQSHVSLTRRTIRLFWFLDSFQSSWRHYISSASSAGSNLPETWIDILSKSAFGMFGMMESATLLDLARVDGVSVFGFDEAVRLDAEAQALWFIALSTSALSTAIKLFRLSSSHRAPQTDEPDTQQGEKKTRGRTRQERAEAKELVRRQAAEKAAALEMSHRSVALGMKLLADLLDLMIPASRIGWIKVHGGLVGVAMLGSTILTGITVWDRCAKKLEKNV
ncbi:hypothetical protein DCS_01776 [Drechmeria coniospora]|uniref:Uncharacterized protein n=1 Tax=Drechmeria coniospora TaxID=98403 RepID=A0A151GU85_DRECN|nr:hypothetical protein DCS_01776 [Drechmeria coniospora]KYK60638.1 hypothetical protein DCS_01776 [Drechmeria coniospora]ODA80794.1 hypothetical protein RJ55_03754 [Drechmeria coniospora]